MYCSSVASRCLGFSILKVGMIAFPWEKGSQESRACDMLGTVLVPSAGSGLSLPVSRCQAHPPANPSPPSTKTQHPLPPTSMVMLHFTRTCPRATHSYPDDARASRLLSLLLSCLFCLLLTQQPVSLSESK